MLKYLIQQYFFLAETLPASIVVLFEQQRRSLPEFDAAKSKTENISSAGKIP